VLRRVVFRSRCARACWRCARIVALVPVGRASGGAAHKHTHGQLRALISGPRLLCCSSGRHLSPDRAFSPVAVRLVPCSRAAGVPCAPSPLLRPSCWSCAPQRFAGATGSAVFAAPPGPWSRCSFGCAVPISLGPALAGSCRLRTVAFLCVAGLYRPARGCPTFPGSRTSLGWLRACLSVPCGGFGSAEYWLGRWRAWVAWPLWLWCSRAGMLGVPDSTRRARWSRRPGAASRSLGVCRCSRLGFCANCSGGGALRFWAGLAATPRALCFGSVQPACCLALRHPGVWSVLCPRQETRALQPPPGRVCGRSTGSRNCRAGGHQPRAKPRLARSAPAGGRRFIPVRHRRRNAPFGGLSRPRQNVVSRSMADPTASTRGIGKTIFCTPKACGRQARFGALKRSYKMAGD